MNGYFSRWRMLALGPCLLASLQLTASPVRGADEEIKTARFRVVGRVANDPPVVQHWYLTVDEIRMEMPGEQAVSIVETDLPLLATTIQNVRLKQSVEISFVDKRVWRKQLDEKLLRHCQNPAVAMRRIVTNEAELVREEKIAGRVSQVYRVKKLDFLFMSGPDGEKDSATLWVDRETKLPVRIELKSATLDGDGCEVVFDEFVWNEPLDAKLFALTPPPGFAVEDADGAETR